MDIFYYEMSVSVLSGFILFFLLFFFFNAANKPQRRFFSAKLLCKHKQELWSRLSTLKWFWPWAVCNFQCSWNHIRIAASYSGSTKMKTVLMSSSILWKLLSVALDLKSSLKSIKNWDLHHLKNSSKMLIIFSWTLALFNALCLFDDSHLKHKVFLSLQWPLGMSEPKHWCKSLITQYRAIGKYTFCQLFFWVWGPWKMIE